MSDYVLSCCSTADVEESFFQEKNISCIFFHFELDGKQYIDDLGKSMPFEDFYRAMADGAMTRTSQPNRQEYFDYFEKFLKEGRDVLHFCLSSGISGALNSAETAAAELRELYPDRKLYIIDTLCASVSIAVMVDKAAEMRDAGATIDEVRDWMEEHKANCHTWFFVTDLTYLIRGGRVSKVSGFVAGMLGICPLMNVNGEGKLSSIEKVRGRKRVVSRIVEIMKARCENGTDYDGKVYISNSVCREDADGVANLIRANFPKVKGIFISSIGTTIGSHTGPGTVAVCFWGDKREH